MWSLVVSFAFAAPGHCLAAEKALFECTTTKGKVVSVCSGEGTLAYRFGAPGKVELAFPEPLGPDSAGRFTATESTLINGFDYGLTFQNADVTYRLWQTIAGGNGDGGIVVTQGGKDIARIACAADTVNADWSALIATAGKPAAGKPAAGKATQAACEAAASRFADEKFTAMRGHMDGMQQGDVYELVKQQCAAGWSAEAAACMADSSHEVPCEPMLDEAQRAALKTEVDRIVPVE